MYLFININGELKSTVNVSPSCGDITGYGMKLNVNGFEPNSNVGWKFVNPETQAIPIYGYFSSIIQVDLLNPHILNQNQD